MAFAGWIFLGQGQGRTRFMDVLWWLVYPFGYFAFALLRGHPAFARPCECPDAQSFGGGSRGNGRWSEL